MPSEIEVKGLAACFGSASLQATRVVKVSATRGKPINWSSQQILINVLEKVKGKPIIWNVGITD